MPTPKTADAHRQQDSPSDHDQDGQDGGKTPPLPDNGDGGSSSGRFDFSMPSFSNKRLLVIGVAAVLAYAAYKIATADTESGGVSEGDLTEEVEDAFNDVEQEESGPNIEHDPNDPLKADAEVMDYLRGRKGDGDDIAGDNYDDSGGD